MSEQENNLENHLAIEKVNNEVELSQSRSKWALLVYLILLIVAISSYFLYNSNQSFEIVLGDEGEITNAVLYVLAMTTFKWLPILSVVGLFLYYNRKRIKDIINLYLFLVLFVFSTSMFIVFVVI